MRWLWLILLPALVWAADDPWWTATVRNTALYGPAALTTCAYTGGTAITNSGSWWDAIDGTTGTCAAGTIPDLDGGPAINVSNLCRLTTAGTYNFDANFNPDPPDGTVIVADNGSGTCQNPTIDLDDPSCPSTNCRTFGAGLVSTGNSLRLRGFTITKPNDEENWPVRTLNGAALTLEYMEIKGGKLGAVNHEAGAGGGALIVINSIIGDGTLHGEIDINDASVGAVTIGGALGRGNWFREGPAAAADDGVQCQGDPTTGEISYNFFQRACTTCGNNAIDYKDNCDSMDFHHNVVDHADSDDDAIIWQNDEPTDQGGSMHHNVINGSVTLGSISKPTEKPFFRFYRNLIDGAGGTHELAFRFSQDGLFYQNTVANVNVDVGIAAAADDPLSLDMINNVFIDVTIDDNCADATVNFCGGLTCADNLEDNIISGAWVMACTNDSGAYGEVSEVDDVWDIKPTSVAIYAGQAQISGDTTDIADRAIRNTTTMSQGAYEAWRKVW